MTAALLGHLDRADRDGIEGWAFDPASPGRAVTLALYDNGTLVLRFAADAYRADLEPVGRDGCCAFQIGLPAGLSPGPHRLSIRDLAGRDLPNSPRDLPALAEVAPLLQRIAEGDAIRRAALLPHLVAAAAALIPPDQAAGFNTRWGLPQPVLPPPAPTPRCLVLAEGAPPPARLLALRRLGHAVLLATPELAAPAVPDGVTLCAAPLYASVEEVLRRQAGLVDLVLLQGVGIALLYAALARRLLPGAKLLLDLPRLDSLAMRRQAREEADDALAALSRQHRDAEGIAAWLVPRILVTNATEAAEWRRIAPCATVRVIPGGAKAGDAALRRAIES